MKKFILTLAILTSSITAFSQVGVGTTTPATGTTLHIDGAKDNTSTTPTATEAANDVVVTSTGNVGIGTTTPAGMLNVSGTTATVIVDRFIDNIAGSNMHLRKARGTQSTPAAVLSGDQLGSVVFQGHDGTAYRTVGQVRVDAAEDYSPSGFGSDLVFLNNPASGGGLTERMRIVANGNVGIGTTAPTERLTVGYGGKLLLNRADNATGSTIHNGGSAVGTVINDLNNEPIQLQTGGTTDLYIASAGNVGIGTTAPGSKLAVVGLPTYADNAAATGAGLVAGDFYRTATGQVMVAY